MFIHLWQIETATISKNTLAIPRLELQAAALATRMKVAIFNSVTVKFNKSVYVVRLKNCTAIHQK